jgi:hypothetical protein
LRQTIEEPFHIHTQCGFALVKWLSDSRKNVRETLVASCLLRRPMPPEQVGETASR